MRDIYCKTKIKLALEFIGREIFFYDGGCKTTFEGNYSTDNVRLLHKKYHQLTYGDNLYGCVWLAACQLFYCLDYYL